MNRAVFFDRDDTLIRNIPYLGDPEQVTLLPGARQAVEELYRAGYLIILITNQSAVGRGLITRDQMHAVNEKVLQLIGPSLVTGVYSCTDHPDLPGQGCRKPSPKMILQAAKDHNIDLFSSYMVGDKVIDIQAGHRAGCTTALLIHPHTPPQEHTADATPDYRSKHLQDIATWILSHPAKAGVQ
jgi:D-glycero-D-manno-heptose 1,7-bisphosphate phosphatase